MAAIPIALLARLASVAGPVAVFGRWRPFGPAAIRVLTWGGLRGGISVALALSIPAAADGQSVAERDVVVALTYVVVVFSILIQGPTVGPLTRRWLRGEWPDYADRSPSNRVPGE
jgi:CPA1 family monovalent cation:H+ antiporter